MTHHSCEKFFYCHTDAMRQKLYGQIFTAMCSLYVLCMSTEISISLSACMLMEKTFLLKTKMFILYGRNTLTQAVIILLSLQEKVDIFEAEIYLLWCCLLRFTQAYSLLQFCNIIDYSILSFWCPQSTRLLCHYVTLTGRTCHYTYFVVLHFVYF